MKFCQYPKPIMISLSPNTEKDDVRLALKLISNSNEWKEGKKIHEIEEECKKYLGVKYTASFNSGRSAFMAILDALEIKEHDEILLQGFTCNAAVNPVLERKAKPIFVDVDETINIDPVSLGKKITPNSKIVMVQHNFGWPAKMDEILNIAKKHNLFLIEDCAHSLGAKYKNRFCGNFGDVAFFSFGRDKIISSVFGGMAVTNNSEIAQKIKKFQEKLDYPSNCWILQQLMHPILTNYLVLPAYGLNATFGRLLIGAFHKLGILSKAVYKEEKKGKPCKYFPKKLANAFAVLALNQFKKIEKFNSHRREIADFYKETLENTKFTLPLSKEEKNVLPIFMRYPVLIEDINTDKILKMARERKIFLDDGWRKSLVVPPDTAIQKMQYKIGECPKAEKVAKSIVNLPTHINISEKDAQKIVDFIKIYGD